MSRGNELTRERIIQTLVVALKPLDYVHAFWEGGAAALNRIDEWSDIDLYLDVDDDACIVEDEKDLKEKYNQATEGFRKIMPVIDEKEIEKLVAVS